MTEKRYFKRMWEEEYYIFDSNTISESDFEEKLEYQDYKAFEDSMMGDEVVNRLNELHEENQALKSSNLEYEDALARLEEQNEELKQLLDYADDLIQSHLSEHHIRQWRNFKTGHKEYNDFWEEKLKKHNELKENMK